MDLRVLSKFGEFWSSCTAISVSRRTVLHGVSYLAKSSLVLGSSTWLHILHGTSHINSSNKTGNVGITWHWTRSCNHCCRGKAISIICSECGFVASSTEPCNAHALYCHLWPLWLYNIFIPYYLIKGAIFGEKLLNTKCVFWFSLQLLSEKLPILRRIQRNVRVNFTGNSGNC